MEDLNVVNDTQQTAVESASAENETGGALSGTPDECTKTEVADRTQSKAENSGFRKLRLENENYKKEIENLKKQLSGLSELENIKRQNSFYINKLISEKMERDLELIRKENSEITDLSELGDDFIRLIENGVEPLTAYNAVKKATDSKAVQTPPSMGSVGYSEGMQSRFFTSKELDRLTSKDLENPLIFKKAMESLKKL